jgi:hypothetical protein
MSVDRVVHRWREAGLLNPPAAVNDLNRFAQLFAGHLPDELRVLYGTANGMVDYASDDYEVSWWSIDRILKETDVVAIEGENWVAIADFFVYSFAFRVGPGGMRAPVRVDGIEEWFPSLDSFFERYLDDPESLGLMKF